ncbi:MAG: plastocyanin/azurin family copper-binding protein, partial [Caldilinea sp.]
EQTVGVTFTADASSVYAYLCTVAGHRQAGMEGRLVVTP